MIEKKVVISNKDGIHATTVAQFISYVFKFKCDIYIIKGDKTANAKSVLSLLMLNLNYGDEITVRVSGHDEEEVIDKIINYIRS